MHNSLGVFKVKTTKCDSTDFITCTLTALNALSEFMNKFVFSSGDSFKMETPSLAFALTNFLLKYSCFE